MSHLQRNDEGATFAVWGSYILKSAFQPIFAFDQGRLEIAAFEGLIRPYRDGSPISPTQFFRTIPAQDRFMVETLTRTLHLLNAAALDDSASIFVNFDPSLFCEHTLAEAALRDMRLVLHETGLAPHRIVCEMTEQVSDSAPALFAFVAMLRGQGFRIAVDDYGADSSDIHRIEQLKPDIVKFDAHWITYLMESGEGFALLKTMVHKFRDQGFKTVFEGLEENWQLDLAAESGADMVQGYVLARPQLAPTNYGVIQKVDAGLQGPVSAPSMAVAPDSTAVTAAPVTFAKRPAQAKTFGRRVSPA